MLSVLSAISFIGFVENSVLSDLPEILFCRYFWQRCFVLIAEV